MQYFYLVINWLVTIASLALGLVALLKGPKLLLNRIFAVFTVASGLWIMASYISNDVHNSPRASLIGNYIVFFGSYAASYLMLWFVSILANDFKAKKMLRLFLAPIILVAALTFTPLVVANVHRQGQVYAIGFGPLVLLYGLGLVLSLVLTMVVLRRGIQRSSGDHKAHMEVLLKSLLISVPLLLLLDFILPGITGWFALTNIALVLWVVPVVGLYYSVVRLRLFSLRLVVVRSLAYILTLAIIGVAYALISYRATILINSQQEKAISELLNVSLIVIAVYFYPYLLKFFRHITGRLFYRDIYDAQEVFDLLNRLLVSTLDMNKLLNGCSTIIMENIRPLFNVFMLQGTEYSPVRVKASSEATSASRDIREMQEVLSKTSGMVVVGELVVQDVPYARSLDDAGVELVVPLMAKTRGQSGLLGYMLLGAKKSGNAYNTQDLRVLETVANELVVAIQNILHFEEIQHFNDTLQQKVDDATRQLRHANQRLKSLDETKDDFISMASHQLRTPLTSVKGYLSMVLDGDAGKLTKMQHDMLHQAFISSQRMVYLISDLLNVSRLKTGKFVIESTPVNLADIISEEIDQLKESAAARQVELVFKKPAKFPEFMLDDTKIRQVIMNFMDNAVYYTRPGGIVTISLDETDKKVELRVKDNGIGVPKAEQFRLFTKFYRAGNARRVRPDGTGLGLFMAKKVVVAQGGVVLFDSQEGKGSTFGFSFDKSKVLVPAK